MIGRDWGERAVCYVCQTERMNPVECRAVNVIVGGFGVCLDHQHTVIAALGLREQTDAIVQQRIHEEPAATSTLVSARRTAQRLGVDPEDIR